LNPALERRLLQAAVAVAGIVPVSAGLWGALGHLGAISFGGESHGRYLSGLLLGIGLIYWWTIPAIERRGSVFRPLAVVVTIGGVVRLAGVPWTGFGYAVWLPLTMELGVTPALALWRERVERRLALL
jgi:hypothetical protein